MENRKDIDQTNDLSKSNLVKVQNSTLREATCKINGDKGDTA